MEFAKFVKPVRRAAGAALLLSLLGARAAGATGTATATAS